MLQHWGRWHFKGPARDMAVARARVGSLHLVGKTPSFPHSRQTDRGPHSFLCYSITFHSSCKSKAPTMQTVPRKSSQFILMKYAAIWPGLCFIHLKNSTVRNCLHIKQKTEAHPLTSQETTSAVLSLLVLLHGAHFDKNS